MKNNFKIISIFSLISIFFVSTLVCCCFIKTVDADETVMSCHETPSQDSSSKHDDECNCSKISTLIEKNISFHKASIQSLAFEAIDSFQDVEFVSLVAVKKAPPDVFNLIPLYIKHSVFRI